MQTQLPEQSVHSQMPQTRRQSSYRSKKSDRDSAMVLEDPFDLALYTAKYMQADSPSKKFRDGDNAWIRFLAARPLLYLPDRTPVVDEDPISHHRRIWTHQELQTFGDVVEERTRVHLLAQERTLRCWHQSATHIQRCFRGMHGRLYVLRLRQELFEHAATLEKAMQLARERRRQRKAAVAIQRGYRCHRKDVKRRERAAIMLQAASKRFMHRLRRWQARLTIQRAVRCFLWRMRWNRYRQRIRKMLNAAARQQQLVLTTEAFRQVRQNVLLQRQADTWAAHPERTQMLLRTRQRKQQILASAAVGIFPPLRGSTKIQNKGEKRRHGSLGLSTQQKQGLPRICPSSRGE